MSTITIAAPTNSTTGVTISVPTSSTTLSSYLDANRGLAVSIPTGATGKNLTSMGKFTTGPTNSVWRLRNGTTDDIADARLQAYRGSFSGLYDLPSGTDTFVVSDEFKTHKLFTPGKTFTKAAGSQTFGYNYDISPDNTANSSYTLIGAGGDDSLTGSSIADILIGKGGNDTLTGNGAGDTFVIAAGAGTDTITDFADGTDFIGLAGGLAFGDLSFSGTDIILTSTTEVLATLTGIDTTALTAGDFVTV